VALLFRRVTNWLLRHLPVWGGVGLQFGMLYLAVSRWASLNPNRERILVYMGIYIMMSVSLNLVNGYMGEFSVGHAGFMGVGAYVSAVITMWAFTDNRVLATRICLPNLCLLI
jgi:branched-chain amino acid transport system permease protein